MANVIERKILEAKQKTYKGKTKVIDIKINYNEVDINLPDLNSYFKKFPGSSILCFDPETTIRLRGNPITTFYLKLLLQNDFRSIYFVFPVKITGTCTSWYSKFF